MRRFTSSTAAAPAVILARFPLGCTHDTRGAATGWGNSTPPSSIGSSSGGSLRYSRRSLRMSALYRARSDVPPDLAKDIDDIIHNDRLVLFLTGTPEEPRCRFTMQMVDLLDQLGVRYGYFNILDDEEVCEGLKRYSSWPTYPQVYVDGELLGGYDICKEMLLDGSLTKLFQEKELL